MLYTIYRTTHQESGKVYIGKHQTLNLDDGYLGSGKHLKHAIKKYGPEAFDKEVLCVFETEEEMNAKEAELVTEEFCGREDTYNLCNGGGGGFSHIIRARSPEERRRIATIAGRANKGVIRKPVTDETRLRMAEAHSRPAPWFNGNTYASGMWINDGVKETKAKDQIIPNGWQKGRLKKVQENALSCVHNNQPVYIGRMS